MSIIRNLGELLGSITSFIPRTVIEILGPIVYIAPAIAGAILAILFWSAI